MKKASLAGIGMTSLRTRQRLVQRLREKGITDNRVLAVIENTPRHLFVDEALGSRAYEDTALPIGHNQTISQPYVVALMTSLMLGEGTPPARVLEIGTGCGYQTAVLAQLVDTVYTVERISALQRQTTVRLFQLRVRNVHFHLGDGLLGWPEHAPYDGILVTAAATEVPQALLAQLADGGRMVIPVGARNLQRLTVVTRSGERFEATQHDEVNFVPLLRGTD